MTEDEARAEMDEIRRQWLRYLMAVGRSEDTEFIRRMSQVLDKQLECYLRKWKEHVVPPQSPDNPPQP